MILLNKKERKNKKALNERLEYLTSLFNEPRPNVSPSSQEWVSSEYYQGNRQLIFDEIKEIKLAIKSIK